MSDNKFQGCFIDESDLYSYDIEWEGMKIATAHTMSAKDRSNIEKHAVTKSYNVKTGDIDIDVDSHAMKTWYILGALTSWELGRAINEDTVSKLAEVIRDHLFSVIQDHEQEMAKKVEETEKN